MKYRKLGTTDLDVSVICLGTMTWGEQNSQKEAFDQMNYSIEKGVKASFSTGIIAGYPVIDISVMLYDGAYHDVDSSVMAFEIAGRSAFKDALSKSKPKLLEPMMKVEVVTPEEFVGDVIGDLNSRRGQVQGMDPQGNATLVKANVPLATMFGYVNNLRSMTQGRAVYTMQFDKYELVPAMVEEELKSKLAS